MVVVEAALNVATAGARPLCLVNNLNFGNPEHPEVMWQLSEAIDGMAEACLALDLPVVGGNVSLYNESQGRDIDPTPIVGVVGLIDELDVPPPAVELVEGGVLILLGGRADHEASLAGSLWADLLHGHRGGQLPPLDLTRAARLGRLLVELVADGLAFGAHDVSDGGLGVCLAELCIASGLGADVVDVGGASALFSETGGRVVVCADGDGAAAGIARRAVAAGVPHQILGSVAGDSLAVEHLLTVPVPHLDSAWRGALPSLLG
ncbi:MAG: Phosphoribosylformylglycinamidine synthase, synthetase subunit [uncultured Acidimicrobiales bacterium]|uniref:Phosphoribosylformylglycinamidine synthase, synthetase subunit n=1 Tax=uncultured Acidimicrobiales bacterium TaxID=310071 RepID=A0A6J4IP32_9ACTN|nr:MAG: Phosphoribosylformylglycinamidine synthase, synthetase subunit [uncultured Acidimicrobiales bacterium]